MIEWFSVQDLAGVAGMPGTEAGVRKRATADGWNARAKAKGKGQEYHLDSLPAETQRALRISAGKRAAATAKKTAAAAAIAEQKGQKQAAKEASLAAYQRLSESNKAKVDAVLTVLAEARLFAEASGLTKGKAFSEFAKAYTAGEITVPADVKAAIPKVSRATLYNWEKARNEKGISALADERGSHRKGTSLIDTQPHLREYIVGMIVEHPHIKAAVLVKACRAEFAGTETTLPSERRLADWVNNWKEQNRGVYTAVTSPDEWKNKYMAAMGSASEAVTAVNELWEVDSTPTDVMLADGRHTIIGVIDVYSRRAKLLVYPTSSSRGVLSMLRRALIGWGVPEMIKADNGSDYKSNWVTGVLDSLGVDVNRCPPFQAWKKPHIERVFHTFSHDLLELLPGFIGHNVAERSQIESRTAFSDRLFQKDKVLDVSMTAAELQTFCDEWLEHEYHTRVHSKIKMSPNMRAAQWRGVTRTISDERVLDILLSEPAGTRRIGKEGIKLNGGTYIHPQLAAHVGEQASLRYDDADMGRIYVYNIDGEYLCTAEDPDTTGVSRMEVAAKAKEIQKESIQEERRRLKAAARKVTKRDVAQQILNHRADEERAQKVREFPRPQVEHTSDGVTAARATLDDRSRGNDLPDWFKPEEIDTTPEQIAAPKRGTVLKADFQASAIQPPEDMAERYDFWVQINTRIKEGTATDEETSWANRFKGSTAFSTGKMLKEMRTGTAARG